VGKLWLIRPNGRIFHIPVQGADVNTGQDPIAVGLVQSIAANRCLSQPFTVSHPTYGTVTIDFSNPNLTGSCNQCGMCCTHAPGDCPDAGGNCGWPLNTNLNLHMCQYLTITGNWHQWPKAGLTRCSVYSNILGTFKGCAYVPDIIKPEWTECGFSEAT